MIHSTTEAKKNSVFFARIQLMALCYRTVLPALVAMWGIFSRSSQDFQEFLWLYCNSDNITMLATIVTLSLKTCLYLSRASYLSGRNIFNFKI